MKCEDCNAFKSSNPKGGVCRANPPQLMVFGMEQVQVPGLKAGQIGQRPITGSGFPETPNDGWCRQFQEMTPIRSSFSSRDLKALGEVSNVPASKAHADG